MGIRREPAPGGRNENGVFVHLAWGNVFVGSYLFRCRYHADAVFVVCGHLVFTEFSLTLYSVTSEHAPVCIPCLHESAANRLCVGYMFRISCTGTAARMC